MLAATYLGGRCPCVLAQPQDPARPAPVGQVAPALGAAPPAPVAPAPSADVPAEPAAVGQVPRPVQPPADEGSASAEAVAAKAAWDSNSPGISHPILGKRSKLRKIIQSSICKS